ncbi:hypothetical protein C2845_PM07G06270 [Panicum miliaceum]|uniref:Uncharacterized protein n=1 Tax=Panicum miliaceum TaxID=4540 RepID=A0A3L6SSP9_PANMI|nr:hypothetical protein C2845_PM07G06270 [Panicum miliaceum]
MSSRHRGWLADCIAVVPIKFQAKAALSFPSQLLPSCYQLQLWLVQLVLWYFALVVSTWLQGLHLRFLDLKKNKLLMLSAYFSCSSFFQLGKLYSTWADPSLLSTNTPMQKVSFC